MVVHGITLEIGQDATSSHAVLTPLRIDMVIGQFRCASHMQPVQLPCNAQTAFVEMNVSSQ